MKTVILALVVLVVVSQAEALKCYCSGTHKICPGRVETCSGFNPVCASVTIQAGPHISYMRGCMKSHDCQILTGSSVASGRCCSTDLCN